MSFERFDPGHTPHPSPIDYPAVSIRRGGACYFNRHAAALVDLAPHLGVLYDRDGHRLAFERVAAARTGVPTQYSICPAFPLLGLVPRWLVPVDVDPSPLAHHGNSPIVYLRHQCRVRDRDLDRRLAQVSSPRSRRSASAFCLASRFFARYARASALI